MPFFFKHVSPFLFSPMEILPSSTPNVQIAKHCLETYNGQAMPVPDLPTKVFFRLNNAVGPTKGGGGAGGEEYVLFIGDIGREVNDHMLYSLFREKYQSIKNAKVRKRKAHFFHLPSTHSHAFTFDSFFFLLSSKVVLDPGTGASKGYGFVRFHDSFDYQR